MITTVKNAQLANWIHYIQRPDIHKVIVAKEIKAHMERLGKSQRDMAKLLGMKKSTLHDLLCLTNYTVEEYNKLQKQGITKTQLYHRARSGKDRPKFLLEAIGVFHTKLRQGREDLRDLEIQALEKLEDLITDIMVKHRRGEKTGESKMLKV